MLNRRRAAALAALMWVAAGCAVGDDDIEHWKHTQRGPRKITTVLVESRYAQPLRVHAARALVEMKHPNANGLELLATAMQAMPASEREGIVHALLPELQRMMTAGTQTSPTAASGPSEPMIKAKDAAYVLLRGDGRASFASAEDRAALANLLLDWLLADFNQRALAGSYTAEQTVNAIGSSAAERLTRALTSDDNAIPVSVEISRLINGVGTPQGKQAAVSALVRNATEIASPAATARLRTKVIALLTVPGRDPPAEARIVTSIEALRSQYLTVLFEAIKTLAQPNGTEYLLTVARDAAAPIERRRLALAAMTGAVTAANVPALMEIYNACPAGSPNTGAQCDVELRGLAIDRVGDTRSRETVPALLGLFDQANGTAADQGFTLRWKIGEAIIRLGGAGVVSDFMTHLATARPAPFAGYTFAEINGEAQALGDISPPPRAALRAYTAASNPQPVRLLAMLFLGIKGEAQDIALLQSFAGDTTPVVGEAWSGDNPSTVGAVATRSKDNLQNALRAAQQAPAQP